MKFISFHFLFYLLVFFHLCVSHYDYDPYKILRVSRHASPAEILKAYKQLVKELHPDSNKSLGADEDEFVKVVKAYQLLTDTERRQLYDDRGIYDDSSISSRHRIEDRVFTNGTNYLEKESVNGESFKTVTIPKSFTSPQLLLLYGDYCADCARAALTWRTITEELTPIGINFATLHAEKERSIARRMGVLSLPTIILLINGLPHILRESASASSSVISASRVVAFVRSKLLVNELLTNINVQNIDTFLNSWLDNRVRVLIFTNVTNHKENNGNGNNIRLEYLILAFRYRERAAFGVTNQEELKTRFGFIKNQDNILLFKECSTKPVATLGGTDIPYSLMKDLLEKNKFLVLPRLSSQGVLEAICPADSSNFRRRRHLCVVLITPDDMSNQVEINSLRSFANSNSNSNSYIHQHQHQRVRFAYIFKFKQQEFVQSLTTHEENTKTNSNLVIIWRQDSKSHISYEWAPNWVNINSSSNLETLLDKLLTNAESNFHMTEVKECTDEGFQQIPHKIEILQSSTLTCEPTRSEAGIGNYYSTHKPRLLGKPYGSFFKNPYNNSSRNHDRYSFGNCNIFPIKVTSIFKSQVSQRQCQSRALAKVQGHGELVFYS